MVVYKQKHKHKQLVIYNNVKNSWPIPVFRLEKDDPKTDPYELQQFRYRGSLQCLFDPFVVEVIAPKKSSSQ